MNLFAVLDCSQLHEVGATVLYDIGCVAVGPKIAFEIQHKTEIDDLFRFLFVAADSMRLIVGSYSGLDTITRNSRGGEYP